jgi:outer membrane protein OmpA-like peptidoglycan-associated protein
MPAPATLNRYNRPAEPSSWTPSVTRPGAEAQPYGKPATCFAALVGCETVQDNQRTAVGAGVGAAAGAALGTLVGGDDRRNALVGAGIGLLAGGAVGQYLDRQERDLEASLAGTGAEVERQGDQLLVTMPSQVTFATDSAQIQPQFYNALNSVAQTLQQYPSSYVDIVGHTDNTGEDAYNQQLSDTRARAVADYLISRGVNPARIAAYGQGESQPVASNDTETGRQANRRVEVVITPATQG